MAGCFFYLGPHFPKASLAEILATTCSGKLWLYVHIHFAFHGSIGPITTINLLRLILVGGLEHVVFPFSWEWNNHPN
jgi:hypothetical protein